METKQQKIEKLAMLNEAIALDLSRGQLTAADLKKTEYYKLENEIMLMPNEESEAKVLDMPPMAPDQKDRIKNGEMLVNTSELPQDRKYICIYFGEPTVKNKNGKYTKTIPALNIIHAHNLIESSVEGLKEIVYISKEIIV